MGERFLFGVAGGCIPGGCLRMERGKLPNIPIFLDWGYRVPRQRSIFGLG